MKNRLSLPPEISFFFGAGLAIVFKMFLRFLGDEYEV